MVERLVCLYALGESPDDDIVHWPLYSNEEKEKYYKALEERRINFQHRHQIDYDFELFASLLNNYNVDYILIGGYAIAFYGYIRNIGDIDFWIKANDDNIEKLLVVLKEFGVTNCLILKEDLLDESNVMHIGIPPHRIDLIIGMNDFLNFGDCKKKCVVTKLNGIKISVIAKEDLKILKTVSGRAKDIDDLKQLI